MVIWRFYMHIACDKGNLFIIIKGSMPLLWFINARNRWFYRSFHVIAIWWTEHSFNGLARVLPKFHFSAEEGGTDMLRDEFGRLEPNLGVLQLSLSLPLTFLFFFLFIFIFGSLFHSASWSLVAIDTLQKNDPLASRCTRRWQKFIVAWMQSTAAFYPTALWTLKPAQMSCILIGMRYQDWAS